MRHALGSLLLPAFLVIYILFFLGTVDGRLGGDDHFALWASSALQAGDRLNVDVFDIGIPLQIALSYLGQTVTGSRPIAEVATALALRLLGLVAVYLITRRLVQSRIAAVVVVATVALLRMSESVYGAEKMALYPVAVLAVWRYLEGKLSPYVLSAVIAIAALLRHDHGVYLAVVVAVAVWFRPDPGRTLVKVAVGALALLTPWLFWVQATEGLWVYASSRASFSQALGLGGPRALGFLAPYLWEANAARWLWHVAAMTSVAALLTSVRKRSPAVIVLATTAIVAAFGLMRKEGQVADVATLWMPLFVWLIREAGWYGKAALAGVAVVSVAAVLTVTDAAEELPQIARDGGGLLHRARSAIAFHSISPPIDAYAPVDDTTDDRLIIRYLYECLRPLDRVWETSNWFPVSYYAQRRPVWHPFWDVGLKNDAASQKQFLLWIQRQQAPVIVTRSHDDPFDAFRLHPQVRAYVMTYYREASSPRFDEFRAKGYNIHLLVDTRRARVGRFEPLDLPCFSE